jgi:hypothetical protein
MQPHYQSLNATSFSSKTPTAWHRDPIAFQS